MNRGDALDRIIQLTKLAKSTSNESEKNSALRHIERLRNQFNITDAALDRAITIEEARDSRGIFGDGPKMFYYERNIKRHVDVIKDEISTALQKISTEDIIDQLAALCELSNDLRAVVEANAKDAWLAKVNVQRARNQVIVQVYMEERTKIETDPLWADRVHMRDVSVHKATIERVKQKAGFRNDLTTSTIEGVVGIHTKKLEKEYWENYWKEHDGDV